MDTKSEILSPRPKPNIYVCVFFKRQHRLSLPLRSSTGQRVGSIAGLVPATLRSLARFTRGFLSAAKWESSNTVADSALLLQARPAEEALFVSSDNPPTHVVQVLEPTTGDTSSTADSFFPNAQRFYLVFLILNLLQIAQATFTSFNCLAQRTNSLQEHTSHYCGVRKKKTVDSFRFSPL